MRSNTRTVAAPLTYILRLEGLLVLTVSTMIYSQLGASWKIFMLLFFLPDISLLAYLINNDLGAICYNIAHSYIVPLLLMAGCITLQQNEWLYIICIWIGHIGFDRMLGYGLKYNAGFKYTHLGIIGRA